MPYVDVEGSALGGGRFGFNNKAAARRELVQGGDLLADRSVPAKKLGPDCFPRGITGTAKDLREPSYHPTSDAVLEEEGDSSVEEPRFARASHNHDRTNASEKLTVDRAGDDADYVDPVSNISDSPWDPGGGPPDYQDRVVSWDLAAGVQPGPQFVYARYTRSGVASNWTRIGRTRPGETTYRYKVEPYWNMAPAAVPATTVEYRIALPNNDRSASLKVTRTGTDGKLADGLLPDTITRDSELAASVASIAWKAPVRVATTGALTLASDFENGDTVDGVVLATGDRVLVKDQAAGAENGIYVVGASGAPVRATDFDATADVFTNVAVLVNAGTANAGKMFRLSTTGVITVGTTALTFAEFSPSPAAHAASHLSNGSDPIAAATTTVRGTVELATNGENASGLVPQADDDRLNYDIIAFQGYLYLDPAASLTAQAMTLAAVAGGDQTLIGTAALVGISVRFTGAHTAGTCTVRSRKNGVGQVGFVATSGTSDTRWSNTGAIDFSGGVSIGAEIDTDGSWNGTSGTLIVVLWVKVAKL